MSKLFSFGKPFSSLIILLSPLIFLSYSKLNAQLKTVIHYTVSTSHPEKHYYHVELTCKGFSNDTLVLKMPQWMPGYYQIMNYAKYVKNFSAGKNIFFKKSNEYTWLVVNHKKMPVHISYDVEAVMPFVASNFLDSTHGYIVPAGMFFYINDEIKKPVTVKINLNNKWNKIATGLETVAGKANEFFAPDFDILYDCPVLMGNLEELPSFKINGIEHKFIGYKLGNFNRQLLMNNLKKVIEAAVSVIGDIPYKQYTFIGIGPGRGGIEHLNNATVSFDGQDLSTPEGMNRTMSFLAHEYFHHYNVKRIRPVELGPFDYEKESRTNLLWVSEGLTVYYEYLTVKRAGLINNETLFADFANSINAFENSPGKNYQSLVQAGYETWSDGPFGNQGKDSKTISYYDKGPVIGLFLDFKIRYVTRNQKSLDDVMRFLYQKYYREKKRGFTDAEFQQACEEIAKCSLNDLFEYVYTTKELDYNQYLSYAGLKLEAVNSNGPQKNFIIKQIDNPDNLQKEIFASWAASNIH